MIVVFFYLIMWLATPLPSFRPAVRPAQTQTRLAVTSAAFWATGTWSSAGTDRSSACSWRSPPAKCDFLSHVAGNGRRPGAGPSPFDARDDPLDGRRRRQGHGGAAGAVRGQGRGARAHGAGDRPNRHGARRRGRWARSLGLSAPNR